MQRLVAPVPPAGRADHLDPNADPVSDRDLHASHPIDIHFHTHHDRGRSNRHVYDNAAPDRDFLLFDAAHGNLYAAAYFRFHADRILVGTGFNCVNLSADVIHWGACEPHTVTITAELTSPAEVHSVEIFVHFTDKASGVAAGWDRGTTLDKQADGSFSITLDSRGMTTYTNAWIVYQLVATNTATHYVARTPVFADQLTLSACP